MKNERVVEKSAPKNAMRQAVGKNPLPVPSCRYGQVAENASPPPPPVLLQDSPLSRRNWVERKRERKRERERERQVKAESGENGRSQSRGEGG